MLIAARGSNSFADWRLRDRNRFTETVFGACKNSFAD
jgi:hypothetical protein